MTQPKLFNKILIANRGEIAVRIIRACQEMGIATIAVYSDADANAMPVRMAEEYAHIGAAPAIDSYLQSQRIIDAALALGADAIHPGYGFLAENADFAQHIADAGLTFIGPSPHAIRAMGDKAEARALMEQSGVPVVPGYQGIDDDDLLTQAAARIGYPVLIKAAAGGGGKGMRIASTEADLPQSLSAARREASHAFGDARLIVEKYISQARHIEFQILADHHGHTIHLNERECSVQRRHQKIIEEAPSPLLDAALREEMGAAAVAAAKAVGYTNAGTVEFIVDPETHSYYFLEMNTRLQVEHPVTELTTGLDLVQAQIQIAAGQRLKMPAAPPPHRHAIECRLYAEDPANNFLPEIGPVLRFLAPDGPGIRIDAGVETGDEITTHYDPMIAKIIVHATNREAAVRRMQVTLRNTVLLGVATNLEFLQQVLAHPVFQTGKATTRFIDDHVNDLMPDEAMPIEVLLAASLPIAQLATGKLHIENQPTSPWDTLTSFRMGRRT